MALKSFEVILTRMLTKGLLFVLHKMMTHAYQNCKFFFSVFNFGQPSWFTHSDLNNPPSYCMHIHSIRTHLYSKEKLFFLSQGLRASPRKMAIGRSTKLREDKGGFGRQQWRSEKINKEQTTAARLTNRNQQRRSGIQVEKC